MKTPDCASYAAAWRWASWKPDGIRGSSLRAMFSRDASHWYLDSSIPGFAYAGLVSRARTPLLDDQLCFALYAAAHRVQALYRPLLAELGLTYSQYIVLLVLWENDHLGIGEIGDRLGLTSATLTPLMKRMENAGLVERRRSCTDERKVTVSLTAKSAQLESAVSAVTARVNCAAEDVVDDVGDLIARLEALRVRLPLDL